MSMDPSMIEGTGLLELVRPPRKPKEPTSRKAGQQQRGARESGIEPPQAIASNVIEADAQTTPEADAISSVHARAYLRFLALAAQTATKARTLNEEESLDPNEKALLELIILRWAVGSPMTVRQAIALAHLGSPATLHKRLMRLRNKNFLDLEHVTGDRRVKRLIIGPVGMRYLKTMGQHLMAAPQAAKKSKRQG